MRVLSCAPSDELESAWNALDGKPDYRFLRRPEAGLVMVRGRIGGTGGRFNLGEMTMTRCVVQLADGGAGYGYVAGRQPRHAELAAVFDALMNDPARRRNVGDRVVAPLRTALDERRAASAAKAAAAKVDFFTVVRGDD